jgi:predicted CoA-binding protein
VSDADQILRAADSIVVVDWPSRDVPDTLSRAGYDVSVKGGPGPGDYSAYDVRGDEVVDRPVGHPPAHADLVYSYRPVSELPAIVALAREIGAAVVWHQSGQAAAGEDDPRGCWMPGDASQEARAVVESAGLTYVEAPYIADAVRSLGIRK